MIKLQKIVRTNDIITCEAFVEDCAKPLNLVFDVKSGEFKSYTMPKGYEWCKSHIHHAKNYLASIMKKSEIPSERTIMWY